MRVKLAEMSVDNKYLTKIESEETFQSFTVVPMALIPCCRLIEHELSPIIDGHRESQLLVSMDELTNNPKWDELTKH